MDTDKVATEAHRPVIDLVALLASAGGLAALSTVLRDLPTELPVAIVVQQHLGAHGSVLDTILRRQTARRIDWAHDGQAVAKRRVVVCPPGVHLELTPQGRCRLRAVRDVGERRFDLLLVSLAKSYGPRGVGVVLSGSGLDGAAGTAAMKQAGALVIAQSSDTAQYPSMPMAAARAGADLVLPVHEIGFVLASIVEGAPLPDRKPDRAGARGPAAQTVAAPGDGRPEGRLGDEMNSAQGRAEYARLRTEELRRRRQDLSAGFGATAQTVNAARRRAEEARRRAELAHQAAEEAAARRGH